MFGHGDNSNKDENQAQEPSAEVVHPPETQADGQDWQHPGTPIGHDDPADGQDQPEPADDGDETAAAEVLSHADPETSVPPPAADLIDQTPAGHTDLVNIKQQALTQLAPLVDHLDQPSEERFRTLMMMIQASDDQTLVKDAYEAAQKITDEKVRAQALLDIVNEINYFTSQHQS